MTVGFYLCCILSLVDLAVTHVATRKGLVELSLLRFLGKRPNPVLSLLWRAAVIGGFVFLERWTQPQPPLWWILSALLAVATVHNLNLLRGVR